MQHGLCEPTLDGNAARTILQRETSMPLRAHLLTAWLALAVFTACGSTPTGSESSSGSEAGAQAGAHPGGIGRFGGQTGGEAGIRCNADVALEPLDFDAASPSGYSAADILKGLAPSYTATFSHTDDSTSALLVTLASDGGRAAYAAGCSRNEIDVIVGWSTSDGAFSETLHGQLFALSPDSATLRLELPAAELIGGYASAHAAELLPPPVRFSFEIEFDPSSVHGSVSALRGPLDSQDSLAIGSF
jgi:hypothetical protein